MTTDVQAPQHDLLVVGGGPAGLAGATAAARAGLRVLLVDERSTLGGQIYKQPGRGFVVEDHDALGRDHRNGRRLIDAAVAAGVQLALDTAVVALSDGGEAVLVPNGEHARTITAARTLLTPGAHDRPMAFPGWTLPGVLTAGGAQTLVKTQRVSPGRRVLFAGSGPLALAFPAQLRGYGVDVVSVLEAGPAPAPVDVARIALAARGNRSLLRDAIRYRTALLRDRVPLRYGRIVVRAEGTDRLERVVHAAVDRDWRPIAGTEEVEEVDALCIGYGFFPSIELLRLAGCELRYDERRGGPAAVLDEWMRTSADGVLAAGDGTGVEGSYVAIAQGRIAGLRAAADLGALSEEEAVAQAAPLRRSLERRRAFGRALERMHRVGPGAYELIDEHTVVCRCESVTAGQLERAIGTSDDINVVKGLTRAGMGPCQGRECQRQVAAMVSRAHGTPLPEIAYATPRMPVRPVPISAIADERVEGRTLFTRTDDDADVPAAERAGG